jgi:hypothetical protein
MFDEEQERISSLLMTEVESLEMGGFNSWFTAELWIFLLPFIFHNGKRWDRKSFYNWFEVVQLNQNFMLSSLL